MRIEVSGNIGIVSTKRKYFNYKRKGYWVGQRWVKPKTIRKYKDVPIKEPYLSGNIELKVYEDFVLRGVYVDESERKYFCVTKNFIRNEPTSILKIIDMNIGNTFSPPKSLTLLGKPTAEY